MGTTKHYHEKEIGIAREERTSRGEEGGQRETDEEDEVQIVEEISGQAHTRRTNRNFGRGTMWGRYCGRLGRRLFSLGRGRVTQNMETMQEQTERDLTTPQNLNRSAGREEYPGIGRIIRKIKIQVDEEVNLYEQTNREEDLMEYTNPPQADRRVTALLKYACPEDKNIN